MVKLPTSIASKKQLRSICEIISGEANFVIRQIQVTKSIRWMPRRKKAMKDVASCDKLRLAASKR